MRYKRILVHGQLLVNVFTQDVEASTRCIKGLPEKSRFAYAIPDIHYGIWLVVEHESFDNLKDGDEIPVFPRPEMEKL